MTKPIMIQVDADIADAFQQASSEQQQKNHSIDAKSLAQIYGSAQRVGSCRSSDVRRS